MAIRQEQYTIYIRPYAEFSAGSKKIPIYIKKDMNVYMHDPLVKSNNNFVDPHKQVSGADNNGVWLMIYSSNSFEQIRTKYKRLLDSIGSEHIKVEKRVPIDIVITPMS